MDIGGIRHPPPLPLAAWHEGWGRVATIYIYIFFVILYLCDGGMPVIHLDHRLLRGGGCDGPCLVLMWLTSYCFSYDLEVTIIRVDWEHLVKALLKV